MGKRVADQHAVMDRGWAVADELAELMREDGHDGSVEPCRRCTAVRRYEEARQS